MDLGPWYNARSDVAEALQKELLGPVEPMILDEPPLNRIMVGILHPKSKSQNGYRAGLEDEERELSSGGGEGDLDSHSTVALSRSMAPSSMGMTFAVHADHVSSVDVRVKARRYEERGERWHPLDIAPEQEITVDTTVPRRVNVPVSPGALQLVGVVRPAVDGVIRVTLTLVNLMAVEKAGGIDGACWFRPELVVTANGGGFADRRRVRSEPSSDPDVRSAEFLYRNSPVLAVGHGCAVNWNESGEITELRSTFMPYHDVKLASPSGGDDLDEFGDYDLEMEKLASGTDTSQMLKMVAAYERWIEVRTRDAEAYSDLDREQALEHIRLARRCASRIRLGIDSLSDPDIGRAFRLMNDAMVEQRLAQDRARGAQADVQRWRPFQLAFILMNLPALADSRHPERETVDLLWFPTGGGKTEAYLGCIGFSILLRRLRRETDGGVSAIMRYTLRLLTRQQFERASGLICALEVIRRRELAEATPVSLGLWVGNSATPNKVADAQKILNDMASGVQPEGSTPVQLLRCPWCGSPLSHENYAVIRGELTILCSSSFCDFADGLPLYVTDEDVYRVRPSLVIGTVDKFAMMTWREEVGEFFSVKGAFSPPDLIVQDELHLISGPLGTMVGLYESALDMAFTTEGRPKVLASTATIRRAEKQIRNVFARDSFQFPPPGLTPEDNYFAVEADESLKGTRRYLGVMAPGASQATLLVRVYAALLQAVADLDSPDLVRDNFWTLLGYFNSLRVLGSTYLQVLDDVPERVKVLAERYGVPARDISQEPVELTSRVDQTRIPAAMSKLETSYPSSDSPDVALATNMISVGLDIDRLGLMVVAGQPQSTSEYIQSTSRVGRRNPGLVVVVLNGHRSRDASHYESFIPFHRALYREVEATTATPYASRARDRGAHGALVAAIRLAIRDLRADGSAPLIRQHRAAVQGVIDKLVARASSVAPDEASAYRDQLAKLVDFWEGAVSDGRVARYGSLKYPGSAPKPGDRPLLTDTSGDYSKPESYPVGLPPWPSLSSMRDVDAETNLYIKYFKTGE